MDRVKKSLQAQRPYFNKPWITTTQDFFEKSSNLKNVRPVAAGLFHADGHGDIETDTTKLTANFRNSANVT